MLRAKRASEGFTAIVHTFPHLSHIPSLSYSPTFTSTLTFSSPLFFSPLFLSPFFFSSLLFSPLLSSLLLSSPIFSSRLLAFLLNRASRYMLVQVLESAFSLRREPQLLKIRFSGSEREPSKNSKWRETSPHVLFRTAFSPRRQQSSILHLLYSVDGGKSAESLVLCTTFRINFDRFLGEALKWRETSPHVISRTAFSPRRQQSSILHPL